MHFPVKYRLKITDCDLELCDGTGEKSGAENGSDEDLGSGGALVLPDLTNSSNHTKHLAVGVGKDANIYIVDREKKRRPSNQ